MGFLLSEAGLPIISESGLPLFTQGSVAVPVQRSAPAFYNNTTGIATATLTGVTAGNSILLVSLAQINKTGGGTISVAEGATSYTSLAQQLSTPVGPNYAIADASLLLNAAAGTHNIVSTMTAGATAYHGQVIALELTPGSGLDVKAIASAANSLPATGNTGNVAGPVETAYAAFSGYYDNATTITEPGGYFNLLTLTNGSPGGSSPYTIGSIDMLSDPLTGVQSAAWGTVTNYCWAALLIVLKGPASTYSLALSPGFFTATGQNLGASVGGTGTTAYYAGLAPGAFFVTGSPAYSDLEGDLSPGAFLETGEPLTGTASSLLSLALAPGNFLLTGAPLSNIDTGMTLSPGSFALAGQPLALFLPVLSIGETTNVYSPFTPDIALILDECFERCGIAPEAIGQSHIDSALRSITLMLNSEWHTLGIRQWMIQDAQYQTTLGLNTFTLPVGGIDIFDAVIRRQGRDTPINRMSPAEYLEIPDKTQTGRPDRYYCQRLFNGVTVWLWRTPENSTDIIVYKYFRQMAAPGPLANILQMPPHVLEAFHSGLSAKLALKFNKQVYTLLNSIYLGPAQDPTNPRGMLGAALMEDRDRTDANLTIQLRPRGGAR